METLAAALPQESDIPGTYFSVECRSLQEPCADLWGVGVVVSEEPEDPASASTKGGRIAIYPEAGTGSSVPPAEAFASAQEKCRPEEFDVEPSFDPRGLGPHGRNGERGKSIALSADITGWQTVSCVRDFVTYVAAPGSTVTDPEYVDTGTRQEVSTAALGKTATGEDIIVIVTAGNPEALEDLQDGFFERLEEEAS